MRFSVFFMLIFNFIFSQTQYPKDYFVSPIAVPMQLSGNFGELRPNHFHAGFDLKTLQKEGLPVYAIADGYISRIKISTFGNGKTIYITHPNGYTSVYGHLQGATGVIKDYIFKAHYALQSFEIELFPKPDELIVQKGQNIAFSGNSGASEGPHLHFEIRDSKTEKVINPMLFGFDKFFKDTKVPIVSNVLVYPLGNRTMVNQSYRPIMLNLNLQKDGTYLADKVVSNGRIGFGINACDYDDVSFNRNGIYKVSSTLNGKPIFDYQFDTYSFDEMTYINAFIDYPRYKKTQQRFQKLFMTTPYNLSFIHTDESNGIISILPNVASIYTIEVSDYFGNNSKIMIPIQYDLLPTIIPKEPIVSNYFVKVNKDNIFAKDNFTVFFPAGTFYDDFDLNLDVKNNTLFLHDDSVPVYSSFSISLENTTYSDTQKEKLFIGTIKGKKISYNKTYLKDNVFTTKVKTLGQFALVIDTIAPNVAITKAIEGKWINAQKTLELLISDELSGIKSYNGFLNGNWILFDYDNKTRKLKYNFSDGIVAEGANDLKVIVLDNAGNSTIFEIHFFRSQINNK
jgi:hypothetical protein